MSARRLPQRVRGLAVLVLLAAATVPPARAQEGRPGPLDGLAPTPPMGWNSWNRFGCDVSESLIREVADAMVSSGMRDAGYEYVVIDDCWQVDRDGNGEIVVDPERFPSGMKALADYVHSKGLKFGIYSDAGTATCQGRPGSRGHEYQDARTYASWGVDYLKYDWCNHGTQDPEASYRTMRSALEAAGRPIVFSICEWGSNRPWLWAGGIGHLWRTTADILNCYDCRADWGGMGFVHILDLQDGLESFTGPGGWNDPDMLQVGNDGLTEVESQAHFSLWAVMAAPLMAGNDIRSMSPATRRILTNPEVIEIDQDPLGRQGRRVSLRGDLQVWAKELHDGARAVVLFNRGDTDAELGVTWPEIGYPSSLEFAVRDLWRHEDVGRFARGWTTRVPAHGAVMIRVAP